MKGKPTNLHDPLSQCCGSSQRIWYWYIIYIHIFVHMKSGVYLGKTPGCRGPIFGEKSTMALLGGGHSKIFKFHPYLGKIWENDPIWLAHIFPKGLVQPNQLATLSNDANFGAVKPWSMGRKAQECSEAPGGSSSVGDPCFSKGIPPQNWYVWTYGGCIHPDVLVTLPETNGKDGWNTIVSFSGV